MLRAHYLLISLMLTPLASAYDLNYDTMTKQSWTGSCGTNLYPPATSFLITDQSATVYFEINNVSASDSVTNQWLQPDGGVNSSGYWNTGSTGNRCYSASLNIAGSSAANLPGTWHARVYVNGTLLFDLSFPIGTGPITPRGPNYTGSFDPIPTDCSHFFGWAQDSNNLNAAVSVDIAVAGFSTVTIQATDYRSDVGGHAWNFYSLQQYEDGQQHQVHVYFTGTQQELPGSPRTFPPPGYTPNSCGSITPRGPVGIQWITKPPSQFNNGDTLSLTWSINGGSQATYSHVHISTDASTLQTSPQQIVRPDQGGTDGTYGQTFSPNSYFTGPLSPGTTLYFIVHASDGASVNYYSDLTQSSVPQTAPPVSSRNLWVYSADPTRTLRCPNCSAQLKDFIVVVEKTPLSGYQKYTITLLGDNLHEIFSAGLTIVRTAGVTLEPFSTQVLRNAGIPGGGLYNNIIAATDSGWQDLSTADPYIQASNQVLNTLRDLVGFFPRIGESAGGALTLQDLYGDVGALWGGSPNVLPSSSLLLLMEDVNNNHIDNLMATRLRASFDSNLVFGVRFVANINDSAGPPQFFLKANNSIGEYIGIEIGSDYTSPIVTRQ